jgi:tight adherence protein C
MEYIIQLLGRLTDDQQTVRVLFIGMIGTAVFVLGTVAMILGMSASDPVRRRLRSLRDNKTVQPRGAESFAKILQAASPYILPKPGWERSRLTARLVHAGYRGPNALSVFFATKILFGVSFPIVALFCARWFPDFSLLQIFLAAGVASFVGMTLPNVFLDYRFNKRTRLLRNAFPDALDLLVVCVEAGLGLGAAIQRVADELAISHPELASELFVVNAEIRAGVDRVRALRSLADRTGLDDIRGLVSLLAQSLRFGTSIAETLRVYSDEFRDKRMQRAEEQAAMIGTKLIFPLVLFLFPSFFLVMVGPAILGVLAALGGRY